MMRCFLTRLLCSCSPSTTDSAATPRHATRLLGASSHDPWHRQRPGRFLGSDLVELCQQGRLKDALDRLDRGGFRSHDVVTYSRLLEACKKAGRVLEGMRVHWLIIRSGLQGNVLLGNQLVSMYGKCGSLDNACRMFDGMKGRNVVSWNAMIAAYSQQGYCEDALQLICRMQQEGVMPNKVTFITVLNASSSPAALPVGRLIHARIVEAGFESDVVVATAILRMYSKCANVKAAKSVFLKIPEPDVFSWNVMIAAYMQDGYGEEALQLFHQMLLEGVNPDKITFINILEVCNCPEALMEGKVIHSCLLQSAIEVDVALGTAILKMYGKCGSVEDASSIFGRIAKRNVVTWTAMIAAYAKHGHSNKALQLFQMMELEGVMPDRVTFLTVLEACACVADLAEGRLVHVRVVERGLDLDMSVGNAIVNMYGKCGSVEDARRIFDTMRNRNVVSWTSMISAYAQNGYGKEALQLFERMQSENIMPDQITFVSLLSACSHAGLVDEGRQCFASMINQFGITPMADHYDCIIDILGRAGKLDEAEDLINKMPFQPGAVVWKTLLGACRIYCNVELGKCAAEHVFELDPQDAAGYVMLSNIYATMGQWDTVAIVRKAMTDRGAKKDAGYSSIEVNNT